jgi:pimeloyl-ACP methyl ester carboxylesterase
MPVLRRLVFILLLLPSLSAFAYDKDVVRQSIDGQLAIANLAVHTISLGGQKIAYLDSGNSKAARTIVFVHGFGDSGLSWTFMARMFRDYRVLIPDLLGFGDSARPADGDYSYKAQAGRVLAIMKSLNIEHAHFVGNSMGGGVAAEVALLQPAAVDSLTLMDAAGVHYRPTALDRELLNGHNLLLVNKPEDFVNLIDFVTFTRPLMTQPIIDFLSERAVKDNALHQKIFREVLFPDIDFLLLDLGNIKTPTLILWGEQDRVLSPENAKVFNKYIPGSQIVTLPDVGHTPMIEAPEKSGMAVRQFIDGIGHPAGS